MTRSRRASTHGAWSVISSRPRSSSAGSSSTASASTTSWRSSITGSWPLERETAFHLHQQDVLTPDALRQALGEMRDDLRRFEVVLADFRDEDTAREVACCVREDRDSFRRAASRAGETQRHEEWFQQDL